MHCIHDDLTTKTQDFHSQLHLIIFLIFQPLSHYSHKVYYSLINHHPCYARLVSLIGRLKLDLC